MQPSLSANHIKGCKIVVPTLLGFSLIAGIAAILAVSAAAADDGPAVKSIQDLVTLRKQLAHRERRVIFNNDGNEPVYYCKEISRKGLLEPRTLLLKDTMVDTIFYCTWSSGFGHFTHNTKVGEIFNSKEKPFDRNKTQELIDAGLDPLEVMVDWCRENEVEVFWSMRMNDVHDGSYPPMVPQWKKDHPEFLYGTLKKRPSGVRDGREWAGVDYARAEVRDRALAFFEEVCENYDVDGIEMDFFRHPVYFKSRAWGKQVAKEEIRMMTDFIRGIRAMTERIGLKRGKPILVAIRVPDSVGYCLSMGLDIEDWLEQGFVDMMTVSGYFQLCPWETSVEFGHKYGIPVYCGLSESRIAGKSGSIRRSYEAYRARATNVWNSGADGVSLFNYFNPRSPLWSELGDPDVLKKLDKTYFVNIRGVGGANMYSKDGEQYRTLPDFSPERPITLQPGKAARVPFPVGENILWGKDEGIIPQVTFHLQFKDLGDAACVDVAFNDAALTDPEAAEEGWVLYPVKPELVKQGENVFSVGLKADAEAGPVLMDSMLKVNYPDGK